MFTTLSLRRAADARDLMRHRPVIVAPLPIGEPGNLRLGVVMNGGTATDDVTAALRTALHACGKRAVRCAGLVRITPRPAGRCSVGRAAAPPACVSSLADAGRHGTAGGIEILPAV